MSLRQSMAGLHTWGGLLPSWLLYVIILAGTIACFDKELERWMRPALHEAAPASMTADQVRDWLQRNVKDELHAFWMHGPTEREPYWRLGWEVDGTQQMHDIAFDPASGQPLPGSKAATSSSSCTTACMPACRGSTSSAWPACSCWWRWSPG